MDNVVKLKGDKNPAYGTDAVSEVIQFLRKYADALERGEARPAHKAVLIMYEDRNEQFRISTAYCNATTVERAGIISVSLHDTVDID